MSKVLKPVAVVTGASGEIGGGVTQRLLSKGYSVIGCSRTLTDGMCKLDENNASFNHFRLDLESEESVVQCAKDIKALTKDVSVLVNCAGIASGSAFALLKLDELMNVFAVNYFGQIRFMQLMCNLMIRQRLGSVVNVTSMAGLAADRGTLAYGGSKAAMAHATRVMAAELGAFNIRVNAVAPSRVESKMGRLMDQKSTELLESRAALQNHVEVADVVDAIEFLISSKASKITGQILRVDRGWSL